MEELELSRSEGKSQKAQDYKLSSNRRKRIPIACYPCRLRKVKCGREKPYCASCVTKNITHLCKYEEEIWTKESPESVAREKLIQEIERLREQVRVLQMRSPSTSGERVSPSQSSDHRSGISNGGSSGSQARRGDKYLTLAVKNLTLRYYGVTSYMFFMLNDVHSYEAFSLYLEGQVSMRKEIEQSLAFRPGVVPKLSDHDYQSSITGISSLPMLPDIDIMNFLIGRFIIFCSHLVPFMDVKSLSSDLAFLLSHDSSDLPILAHKYPAHVATLLIVLRFAFLSLPLRAFHDNKLTGATHDRISQIFKNNVVISISYIDYASTLILSAWFFRKCDTRELNAALLLYVYKMHSPEDDHSTSDLTILFGNLVQMANLMGLHDSFDADVSSLVTGEELILRRKAWDYILYYDAKNSFNLGTPLLVHDRPNYPISSKLLTMFTSSDGILESHGIRLKLTSILRRIVINTENTSSVNVPELESQLEELNSLLKVELYNFEMENRTYDIEGFENVKERIQALALKVEIKLGIYIVYCALFIFTKNTNTNLSNNYYTRALDMALQIIKIGYDFATGEADLLCAEYEVIYAKSLWTPMQKVLPMLASSLHKILKGEGSVVDSLVILRNGDSDYSSSFLKLESDKGYVNEICAILRRLNAESQRLSSSYLSCFKATLMFETILGFIISNYAHVLDDGNETESSENIFDLNINSKVVQDFFESQNNNCTFDFDYFLTSLSNDFSPFFTSKSSSITEVLEDIIGPDNLSKLYLS